MRITFVLAAWMGALAACTPSPQSASTSTSAAAAGPFGAVPTVPGGCHVTADGGPDELAERGIGGTGGAAAPPPPPGPIRPSLGVAGIIDGFGSVCLNGLEVRLLPSTIVTADGAPVAAADLRIGQQAVLAAAWADGRPVTDRLRIRHAVIGPIERTAAAGRLVVAGQTVWLSGATWIDASLTPGRFVSVSGLRMPSGDILASRIDGAAGAAVLVHGRLEGTQAKPRIGTLAIMPDGQRVTIGSDVVLRGIEDHGALRLISVLPDLLADDPGALFGDTVRRFLIQTVIGSASRPAASLSLGLAPPTGMVMAAGTVPAVIGVTVNPTGTLSAQTPDTAIGGWAGPPTGAPAPSRSLPSMPRGAMSVGRGPPGTQSAHGAL